MKKTLAEVDTQQLTSQFEARLAAIERRLEKLDPSPKIETLQPYPVGSEVFSVSDQEGSNPLTVLGYERGTGRILVRLSSDDTGTERPMPIESVVPLSKCPRATPTPSQVYQHLDAKTLEYLEGRHKAEIEKKTKQFVPPLAPQRRYGDQVWPGTGDEPRRA